MDRLIKSKLCIMGGIAAMTFTVQNCSPIAPSVSKHALNGGTSNSAASGDEGAGATVVIAAQFASTGGTSNSDPSAIIINSKSQLDQLKSGSLEISLSNQPKSCSAQFVVSSGSVDKILSTQDSFAADIIKTAPNDPNSTIWLLRIKDADKDPALSVIQNLKSVTLICPT